MHRKQQSPLSTLLPTARSLLDEDIVLTPSPQQDASELPLHGVLRCQHPDVPCARQANVVLVMKQDWIETGTRYAQYVDDDGPEDPNRLFLCQQHFDERTSLQKMVTDRFEVIGQRS